MANKPSYFIPSKNRYTPSQLAAIKREITGVINGFAQDLYSDLDGAGVLRPSPDGDLSITGKEVRRYELTENASSEHQLQFFSAVATQTILGRQGSRDYINTATCFLLGMLVAAGGLAVSLAQQQEIIAALTKHRSAGGRASRKLTPEVEKLAREIFAEEKRIGVSNDAAYRRTCARLRKEHGIKRGNSVSSLKRHLGK